MIGQRGCGGRQLVNATCSFELDRSVRIEENIVIAGGQSYRVDVRQEGSGKDPDSCGWAGRRLDFLDQWFGEIRSHEAD